MSVTLSVYGSLLLNLIVGGLLPMLVAAVTKADAHPGLKSVTLSVLSLVYGVGMAWVDADHAGHAFDPKAALATAVTAWVLGSVSHVAALKPLKITGSEGLIAKLTHMIGIG